MPIQNPGAVAVRTVLQEASVAYRNELYVADKIFPIVDGVSSQTKIIKETKGSWFRGEAGPRAPGTAARRSYRHLATSNIDPINNAHGDQVTEEDIRDYNRGLLASDPELDAIEFIANQLDLKREIDCAALLHATNWNSVGAGGSDAEGAWGHATAASDTFLTDYETGYETILKNAQVRPNKFFMTEPCWSKLKFAPALLALFTPDKLDSEGRISLNGLADYLGVEEIIVASAVRNDAAQQVDDSAAWTPAWLWGTSGTEDKGVAFLYYAPDRPSKRQPSAGYQYRCKQINGLARYSTRWPEPSNHAWGYDSQEEIDIVAVSLDAGYMWKDTATT